MMESPSGATGEEHAVKKLDAADHDHHQSSTLDLDPSSKRDPNPLPANSVIITNDRTTSPPPSSPATAANRTKKSVRWSQDLVEERTLPPLTGGDDESRNIYVNYSEAPSNSSSLRNSMATVKDTIGRWRVKVGQATRKAEDLAGNTWHHLKMAPSLTDGALGRIAQGTKVLAEGGYEKIFRQTFDSVPEEQLENSYACYLSTSGGPVMGVLYASTAKLAFCSDNPLSYNVNDKTEWSYYKVVVPLHQLKEVKGCSGRGNSSQKYIQIVSIDSHEFWFMGFLNYDGAVKCLQEAHSRSTV